MPRSPFILLPLVAAGALHLAMAGCAAPAQIPAATSAESSTAPPSAGRPARAQDEAEPSGPPDASTPATAAGQPAEPPAVPVLQAGQYLPRWNLTPGKQLYFEIENEFRDDYHLMLKIATEVRDRRTLVQTISPPNAEVAKMPGQERFVPVGWECTRYEIREKTTGKEEMVYDSLRHLYPPMPLRGLGSIAGSQITFMVDPFKGDVRVRKVQPGKIEGGSAGPQLSGTVQNCAITDVNVANLLDDLWRLYLPEGPVGIGDTWTARRTDGVERLGQIAIDYTFELAEVRREDDRQIGVIRVAGDIQMRDAAEDEIGAPGKAGVRRQKAKQNEKFKIDRTLCEGNIDFDLTRGELLRLLLRREVDLGAKVKSETMPTIAIRKNSSHVLRVRTGGSPQPQPVIVGVRQPPKEPAEVPRKDHQRPNPRASRPVRRGPATQSAGTPVATTMPEGDALEAAAARARRAKDRSSALGKGSTTTTGPAAGRGVRRPIATQPADRKPVPALPTTQPAAKGAASASS